MGDDLRFQIEEGFHLLMERGFWSLVWISARVFFVGAIIIITLSRLLGDDKMIAFLCWIGGWSALTTIVVFGRWVVGFFINRRD